MDVHVLRLRLRDTVCSLIFMKNITFLFSVQEPVTGRSRSDILQYYEQLLTSIVLILMYSVLRRAAMTNFVTFGVWRRILSSERIAGTTFQHLQVILNLLESGSEQLRRCVPGEASDTTRVVFDRQSN